MVYYINKSLEGIKSADSNGDGYSIILRWNTAQPSTRGNKIAYNIYMSTDDGGAFPSNFFSMPPLFVAINCSETTIIDLIPGQLYFFGVRAVEYNPNNFNFNSLPQVFSNLYSYPQSLLLEDISATSSIIPLIDSEGFPNAGIVKIGVELINYSSNNVGSNSLILSNPSLQRGFNNTPATLHDTDGYDGYTYWNPNVIFYPNGLEEQNTVVFQCQNRFDIGHYAFTLADGFKQETNAFKFNTDLTASDTAVEQLPLYDFCGYHRDDPVDILSGKCVGSYIGGRQGQAGGQGADGYAGVGLVLSGLSLQTQANQRELILLSLTGEPCCLFRRQWSGIVCKCVTPANENPNYRCLECFGTGFATSYIPFYNPLISDGRILVRFDPTQETLRDQETGLELEVNPNCWTSIAPSVKTKDFLIRFNTDLITEDARYEIVNVTRNKLLSGTSGLQKFAVTRLRKTSPIYQVPSFYDTAMFPYNFQTTSSSTIGIPPHTHTIRLSETITNSYQINQMTEMSAGHNHEIRQGIVQEILGHSHNIVFG